VSGILSRSCSRARVRATCLAACLLAFAGTAAAQDPNECDEPGDYPDLTLGDLHDVGLWGTVDGISAYSIGASTCNLGTCWANWFFDTDQHAVFAENLFRLKNGRFEQIGQAWVTHRFFALSQIVCEPDCVPTNGQHLGVNCSTTNTATVTGAQQYKGPKSEVDASAGSFEFPFTGQGTTGNLIYKRLQVHNEDLEPGLNPDALYFLEGQNVTEDDATAGMLHNNASWRQVLVAPATRNLLTTGPTEQERPAIYAWATFDAEVTLKTVDVPDEGRFFVASRATQLDGGTWHYEYAIHNLNSHRSAMSVEVPIPHGATVSGIGFHDVDYHSGEPYDGTDWSATVHTASNPEAVQWTTQSFAENANANALRWGTLYNFRFDADAPPASGELVIGLFRPGPRRRCKTPRPAGGRGVLHRRRGRGLRRADRLLGRRLLWRRPVPDGRRRRRLVPRVRGLRRRQRCDLGHAGRGDGRAAGPGRSGSSDPRLERPRGPRRPRARVRDDPLDGPGRFPHDRRLPRRRGPNGHDRGGPGPTFARQPVLLPRPGDERLPGRHGPVGSRVGRLDAARHRLPLLPWICSSN